MYTNDNGNSRADGILSPLEPSPRLAHQLIYDAKNDTHYLFAGNPKDQSNANFRLADLWSLKLTRPSPESILKRCFYLLRKQRFLETCITDSKLALRFLQTEVSSVTDHSDKEQSAEFRALASALFASSIDTSFQARTALYETLIEYFPTSMKQPLGNLLDLISD